MSESYFTAKIIARALKCNPRTVHRQAVRDGWPRRGSGYFFEYQPPYALRSKCRLIFQQTSTAGLRSFVITPEMRAAKLRFDLRWAALTSLDLDLRLGIPYERALASVAKSFSAFHSSKKSLRNWSCQFSKSGLSGLVENKLGRSGRKRKSKP